MNRNYSKKVVLSIALALAIPSFVVAEGFYLSGQVGLSKQASNSEPYGNNIAADSDFPSEFDVDNSAVGGIGLGYRLNENFRLEGRLSHRDGSFNDRKIGTGARNGAEYILKGDIKSTSFMLEAFYDFANSSLFTPYVKAGLGVSKNRYSAKLGGAGVAAFDAFDGKADGYYDNYADGSSTEFSWNVGVGSSYKLSQNISIYGEYQYSSLGNVKTGQDSFTDGFKVDDISTHEVMFGIRYSF